MVVQVGSHVSLLDFAYLSILCAYLRSNDALEDEERRADLVIIGEQCDYCGKQ